MVQNNMVSRGYLLHWVLVVQNVLVGILSYPRQPGTWCHTVLPFLLITWIYFPRKNIYDVRNKIASFYSSNYVLTIGSLLQYILQCKEGKKLLKYSHEWRKPKTFIYLWIQQGLPHCSHARPFIGGASRHQRDHDPRSLNMASSRKLEHQYW